MSSLTPNFDLIKPAKTDSAAIEQLDSNMDTIDTEMAKPPLTVNDEEPDENRNIQINEVPLAANLSTDIAQVITGTFVVRPSGGDAAISNGYASIVSIKGNMVKTGYVPEVLDMTVTGNEISATIDRDTFVSYVSSSSTITLTYSTAWSADPATYGITVTGSPTSGDAITVVYVKENRGTIATADPSSFTSTGWNLYDNDAGYARVVKYSEDYGYFIGGTYSLVDFSATLTGARTSISIVNGYFAVPSDGYVFVTGGNETTYIYATWSDWIDGYQGEFETYTADTINLSEVMLNFPYGLLAVGNVRDEININTQRAINRVQRLTYNTSNLETVIESGLPYDTDTNYIYAALENPVSTTISIEGDYTVSDHGIEFFSGTTVPVVLESLYGENLKDKLRTDVVTISPQTLTDPQKAQVRTNIGAASSSDVQTALNNLFVLEELNVTLKSPFTKQSWAMVHAYKIGKMCIFTFNGLYATSAIGNTVDMAEIEGISSDTECVSIAKVSGSPATMCLLYADKNSNVIRANTVAANSSFYGQIVFFVK